MFNANRALLTGLFLTLVLGSSTGMTVPICADLFKEPQSARWESRTTSVVDRFVENRKVHKGKKITYKILTLYEANLNEEFQRLLEEAGLKVRYETYNWTGFGILPEGAHPLARIAASHNRRGIKLMISPSIWAMDVLGSFDNCHRVFNIDLQTVLIGRADFL